MRALRTLLLVCLLVFTIQPLAFGSSEVISLNVWETAVAPSVQFDANAYGSMYADYYYASYGPYMAVYQVTLEKGKAYTLYMKHPTIDGYMNMTLTGIHPNADAYSYVNGTSSDFIMFFQQPWEDDQGRVEGYRKNFKIADSSESNTFYLICNFERAGEQFDFMIKSPADSDDEVENSTDNFISPHRDGYTWGGIVGYPIRSELPEGLSNDSGFTNEDENTNDGYEDSYYEESFSNEDWSEESPYNEQSDVITDSREIGTLDLNTLYSHTTAYDVDVDQLRDSLTGPFSTAYQIYKYEVIPGQKYTFDFMYKSYSQVNAYLMGSSPLGRTSLDWDSGSNIVLAAFQDQPYHELVNDDFYASRSQFIVDSSSTSNLLYVYVRSDYSNESYKMMLSQGYLSDKDDTNNLYDRSQLGIRWVNEWTLPLKLK